MKPQYILAHRVNARIGDDLRNTDRALPGTIEHLTSFRALESIFAVMDEVGKAATGVVPCTNGCHYCCHSEVAVSKLEADYIALQKGLDINSSPQPLKGKKSVFADKNRPCPFLLANKSCAIYAARPVVCRSLLSFEDSNSKCQFGKIQRVAYLDRGQTFPGAMEAYGKLILRHDPSGRMCDIREYFSSLGNGVRNEDQYR